MVRMATPQFGLWPPGIPFPPSIVAGYAELAFDGGIFLEQPAGWIDSVSNSVTGEYIVSVNVDFQNPQNSVFATMKTTAPSFISAQFSTDDKFAVNTWDVAGNPVARTFAVMLLRPFPVT